MICSCGLEIEPATFDCHRETECIWFLYHRIRELEAALRLLESENWKLQRTVQACVKGEAIARAEAAKRRALGADPWHWMGDGEDHLESLVCPILILPEDLKAALDAAREEKP